jgi:hypothetical protein
MKVLAAALLLTVSLAPAARAAGAVCNIMVDVTDTDPKGLNVRAAPGGKVIAALVNKADWIELHVVGQNGDWFEIDRANQLDNNRMGEDIVMWRGRGYVHRSTVGTSGLQNGAVSMRTMMRRAAWSSRTPPATRRRNCWAAGTISTRSTFGRAPVGPKASASTKTRPACSLK